MPGAMPYLLDKGPYLSVLDSRLANLTTRAQILRAVRSPSTMLADLVGFDSTNLGPDGRNPTIRKAHLNEHWFGMKPNQQGGWDKNPNAFPTGFWSCYQGDPEAILREAMERAIEVSFGLDPHGPVPNNPAQAARRWPIETYWMCQGPWFQCWILWKQYGASATAGHVTVLITTPATIAMPATEELPAQTSYPLTSQITRPTPTIAITPNYSEVPPKTSTNQSQGVYVSGHGDYEPSVVLSTIPTPFGDMKWPQLAWKAIEPVTTVAPSFWEGGVLDAGFNYTP